MTGPLNLSDIVSFSEEMRKDCAALVIKLGANFAKSWNTLYDVYRLTWTLNYRRTIDGSELRAPNNNWLPHSSITAPNNSHLKFIAYLCKLREAVDLKAANYQIVIQFGKATYLEINNKEFDLLKRIILTRAERKLNETTS